MTEFVRPPWASPIAVASVEVVGPTEEPLTLAEAKLRAGLDWAAGDIARDDMMTGFIKAARSQVEQDTGLALLTQTRAVIIGADACSSIMPLPWQASPVQSITDPAGRQMSAFRVDAVRRAVQFAGPLAAGTYTVIAGWPDATTLKAEAPLLVHAVGLLVAHFATLGRDLATADPTTLVPYGYEAAIGPYRLMWVT